MAATPLLPFPLSVGLSYALTGFGSLRCHIAVRFFIVTVCKSGSSTMLLFEASSCLITMKRPTI